MHGHACHCVMGRNETHGAWSGGGGAPARRSQLHKHIRIHLIANRIALQRFSAPSLPWCAQRKRPSGGCAGAGTHLHRYESRKGAWAHLAPSPCLGAHLGRRQGRLWPAFLLNQAG